MLKPEEHSKVGMPMLVVAHLPVEPASVATKGELQADVKPLCQASAALIVVHNTGGGTFLGSARRKGAASQPMSCSSSTVY